jgi:putative NIF3 family GTP cyclohydrolase 1 type 2
MSLNIPINIIYLHPGTQKKRCLWRARVVQAIKNGGAVISPHGQADVSRNGVRLWVSDGRLFLAIRNSDLSLM